MYRPAAQRRRQRRTQPRSWSVSHQALPYGQESSLYRRRAIRKKTVHRSSLYVLLFLVILGGIGWYAWKSLIPPVPISVPAKIPATIPGYHSVQGAPTISAAKINQILCDAGSPACGQGQHLYEEGVAIGINPAYALAFFQHESSFGTQGIALYTRGIGNVKCSAGYTCYAGFRSYMSWEESFRDWYALLNTLYIREWHLTTVEQIIPRYAPASDDNDVQAYISAVVNAVQQWSPEGK